MAYTEQYDINGEEHTVVLTEGLEFVIRGVGLRIGQVIANVISAQSKLDEGDQIIYDRDEQVLIGIHKDGDTITVKTISQPDVILDGLEIVKVTELTEKR
jgi:hypothetical protein